MSPSELLAKSGLYYNLVKKQSNTNLSGRDYLRPPNFVRVGGWGSRALAKELWRRRRGRRRRSGRQGRTEGGGGQDVLELPAVRADHAGGCHQGDCREVEQTFRRHDLPSSREEHEPQPSLWRVMALNAPEWPFILLGTLSSVAMVRYFWPPRSQSDSLTV